MKIAAATKAMTPSDRGNANQTAPAPLVAASAAIRTGNRTKAFDRVSTKQALRAMTKLRLPVSIVRLMRPFYARLQS